jgi:hypothetical protein
VSASGAQLPDLTTPGQDFYDALRVELGDAGGRGARLGEYLDDYGRPWSELPPAARAIFNAAALRFLGE